MLRDGRGPHAIVFHLQISRTKTQTERRRDRDSQHTETGQAKYEGFGGWGAGANDSGHCDEAGICGLGAGETRAEMATRMRRAEGAAKVRDPLVAGAEDMGTFLKFWRLEEKPTTTGGGTG
eukprot:9483448-Pyramimonas_sp.AAC.1